MSEQPKNRDGAGGQTPNHARFDAVAASRKNWLAVIDAITDFIFVVNDQGVLERVNSAFARSLGLEYREIIGKQCVELFGPDIADLCSYEQLFQEGVPKTIEKKIGDELYQISVFPLIENEQRLIVHVMKNVTELKRLKDQLYYADKLASIGLLVSGVAHEINNPLTGTIAYAEMLRMRVTDESVQKDLKKIQDSAERCKKIVDNLLTFSRQRTPFKSLESMNDIIDRTIELRIYWLNSNRIQLVRSYDPAATVFVDAQQIQQVILNIVLNAEQAIVASGRKDGKISFTTRYDRSRRSVVVTVQDNGVGISTEALPRIFDPFFSTKPVGIGTGLGLSISHGIITEHGGTIAVDNAPGGGVLVTIDLPTGAAAGGTQL